MNYYASARLVTVDRDEYPRQLAERQQGALFAVASVSSGLFPVHSMSTLKNYTYAKNYT